MQASLVERERRRSGRRRGRAGPAGALAVGVSQRSSPRALPDPASRGRAGLARRLVRAGQRPQVVAVIDGAGAPRSVRGPGCGCSPPGRSRWKVGVGELASAVSSGPRAATMMKAMRGGGCMRVPILATRGIGGGGIGATAATSAGPGGAAVLHAAAPLKSVLDLRGRSGRCRRSGCRSASGRSEFPAFDADRSGSAAACGLELARRRSRQSATGGFAGDRARHRCWRRWRWTGTKIDAVAAAEAEARRAGSRGRR